MVQVQEYIEDIRYYEQNKELFDKEIDKKDAQKAKEESNVPEGFGKPQPNADQFKTVGFTLKKKRTYQEAIGGKKDEVSTEGQSNAGDKRPKI